MNFCSRFLRLSVVPRCRERPQIAMRFLEWLGRLKWRATGLDASLSFFSTSRRCSRPIVSACSCPTELISSYLDRIMTAIVKSLPSYIKDSIFTMDITSLYTVIPNSEGLQALKHFFDQRTVKEPTIARKRSSALPN